MQRLAVVVLVIVAVAVPIAARPGTSYACSCDAFDPMRAYAGADAVFTGETIDVLTGADGDPGAAVRRQVVRVEQVFKGDVFEEQSVVSPSEDSACGLPWEQAGAIVIVFGYRQGVDTMIPGELAATSCETTALTAASIVPDYGAPRDPTPGVSPIGASPPPLPEGGEVHLSWEWFALGALALVGLAASLVLPGGSRRRARSN